VGDAGAHHVEPESPKVHSRFVNVTTKVERAGITDFFAIQTSAILILSCTDNLDPLKLGNQTMEL